MIPEHKGQHIILVTLLIIALSLSYCAVPSNTVHRSGVDNAQSRWTLRPWLANLTDQGSSQSSSVKAESVADEPEQEQVEEPINPTEKEAEPVPETVAETVESQEPAAAHEAVSQEKPETEQAQAEPEADGAILMNNPQYDSHTKPIVRFTHQKHIEAYSQSCGECHHDDQGQPLDLKPDDQVASCIECHKETKKKKGEKLGKKEKIMTYHKEALHANCIDCHKAYNIEKGDPKGKKPAPVSCKGCHK